MFVNLQGKKVNVQLLEATPNEEKNNKDFAEWLKEAFPNLDWLKAYKEKHYIQRNASKQRMAIRFADII